MANSNRNKVLNFSELKEYAGHLIKGGAKLVYQAHLSAKDKVKIPPLLAEIDRLRAQIAAQRQEESEASKKALHLYWENCTLKTYRSHAEGILRDWIPRDEYKELKRQHEKLKLDFAALAKSETRLQKDWSDFMLKYK